MKSKGEKCSCKNINGNEADDLVIQGMKQLAQPTSEFYQAIKSIASDNDYNIKNQVDEINILEKNYAKNETDINNLINRLALVDDDILDEVIAKGDYFREKLMAFDEVESVSGIGLMIGIKLKTMNAADVAAKALEKGLLILTAKEKVRLLPPLNITYEEIDRGLDILKSILKG